MVEVRRGRDRAPGPEHRAPALALAVLGLWAAARGQTPLWTIPGRATYEASGSSVAGIGDVDRDGYSDFAIGVVPHVLLQRPGLVRVHSGRDGRLLRELAGDWPGDGFGVSVASLGDCDQDGVPDLVVGATPIDSASTRPGYVRVFSGKDWRTLVTLHGASVSDWFGCSVRPAGDVDRDGWPDLIVGAALDDTSRSDAGVARLYAGRDWSLLRTWTGGAIGDRFGYAVAGAGDVDNDGWPDLIAGAYLDDTTATDAGAVYVFSGRDGRRLHVLYGDSAVDGFGFSVAGAGDVDADGHADLLVGSLWDDPIWTDGGSLSVWSGRTGSTIRLHAGDGAYDGLGTSVALVGDQDGDGVSDYASGAVQGFPPGYPGYLRVYSARTGATLWTLFGKSPGDWFGFALDALGDANGDGFPDLVVSAAQSSAWAPRGGETTVVAGRHVALSADRDWVSLATGGQQLLRIDARPVHGGKTCFVLGTMGKTTPGVHLGRLTLPLGLDAYTEICLLWPNSSLLRFTLGPLDASGRRLAYIALPPGLPPSLAGIELKHAFLVFNSAGVPEFASNPTLLRLLP